MDKQVQSRAFIDMEKSLPSQKFDHASKAVVKVLQAKTEKDSEIDVHATNCKKINKWSLRWGPNDKEKRL